MVGVQDVGHVEGSGGLLSGFFSSVKIDKMTCFREVFTNGRKFKSLPGTMEVSDDGPYLGAQGGSDLSISSMIGLADFCPVVVKPKHGDCSPQDIHGSSVFRRGLEVIDDSLRNRPPAGQVLFKGIQFRNCWQFPMMEKIDYFLIATVLYKIIDMIAEVGEATLKAFDV
tara:strand:- start:257 stop:763 length:507 start_codon:yes stop_codon:yes gene_type:complete